MVHFIKSPRGKLKLTQKVSFLSSQSMPVASQPCRRSPASGGMSLMTSSSAVSASLSIHTRRSPCMGGRNGGGQVQAVHHSLA